MVVLNPQLVRLEDILLNVSTDVEIGITNKVATHTYPYSKKKTIEFMGTDTDVLSLEFSLASTQTGGDPNTTRTLVNKLFALAEKGVPLTLVHPTLGLQQIQILSLKQTTPIFGETLYPKFSMDFEIVDAAVFQNQRLLASDQLPTVIENLQNANQTLLFNTFFNFADSKLQTVIKRFRSFLQKYNLTARFDIFTRKIQVLKNGAVLVASELNVLDARIASYLFTINNAMTGILGFRSRVLVAPLRLQNRIATFFSIWHKFFRATDYYLDTERLGEFTNYFAFGSLYNNSEYENISGQGIISISNAIIASIKDYERAYNTEVINQTVETVDTLTAENNDILVAEDGSSVIITEDSSTNSDKLRKLSVAKPQASSILTTNDTLAYITYTTAISFLIDSLLALLAEDISVITLESIQKIQEAIDTLDTYFAGRMNEEQYQYFSDLKNEFRRYTEEVEPFIFQIETVNLLQDILPNALYELNGNLDLFEDSLKLNDTLFFDDLIGGTLLYRRAS